MRPEYLLSLRQGLDGMPDGVCYSKENGEFVFLNKTMKKIMRAAFDSGVNDAMVFEKLDYIGLNSGCRIEKNGGGVLLILQDGSAWNIKTGKITADGVVYNECIAYNVTEPYGKSLELKKRNAHLTAVNEKIREYSKEMDSMIRDRELLDAKIRIHDDVGRALLSLRSYLYRQDKDRESLVKLWRMTISMLRRETVADVSDDRMEALSEAARAVDVTLHYDGEIPNDRLIKEISASAIRECLTNTVKHAGGNNVYISTSLKNGEFAIKIKNDGRKPDKPIEETGGLHTLRRSVERYGGKMTVAWKRGFELTVILQIS